MSDFEGVDLKAALKSVVDSMDSTAKRFRRERYQPKPKAPEPKAEEPAEPGISAGDLEALLSGE